MSKYKHNRPTIGVLAGWQVFSGTLDNFLEHVFGGIQTAARDLDCNLMLACGVGAIRETVLGRPAWPILFPDVDFVPVGPWNTDGLIVLSPFASKAGNPYFSDLLANGFPIVYCGNHESGPAVIVDNESGIQQALTHLVEHGHQRIVFISGHESQSKDDSVRRLSAYLTGVKSLGLVEDPALVVRGFHTQVGGRNAIQEILRRNVPFTAIISSNDESAVGAIQALSEASLHVPHDVAVIGFDDRLESMAHIPMLTTVHHPMFEMGYQSVELLLKYISKTIQKSQVICIPTQLVVRESCGCLPGLKSHNKSNLARQNGLLSTRNLPQAIAENVYDERQRISLEEVNYLCRRLVEAFRTSLARNDPNVFHAMLQQILRQASASGDDLFAWQEAISILRDNLHSLMETSATSSNRLLAEDILHQARATISEVSRGQYAQLLLNQGSMADRIGQMTTRFLTAKDEAEVFQIWYNSLPAVGIQHGAVAYYEPEGEDPVAWSILRAPLAQDGKTLRFYSRHFPPPGIYPENEPFRLALLPLQAPDKQIGFVALDASNLKPSADIVLQLAAALRGVRLYREAVEARRVAEEASRLKSRFLSIVSHELRTPLNLISGLSDILIKESECVGIEDLKVNKKDLERIYIGAQHLDSLIRDVLDLARSDIGQLTLSCEPISINEVLEVVAMIGEQLAHDKELSWYCKIPPDLPLIWGDGTRLRQVALNLVNNAVKFTRKGKISLTAYEENGSVVIMVSDTGLGIPVNEQEAIFDEFRQSDRTAARGFGGLGLGLAICKRLVELHGGRIFVQSSGEEGAGSTFYFSLPVLGDQTKVSFSKETNPEFTQALLLVKDSHTGQMMQSHLLQQGITAQSYLVNQTSDWLAWLVVSPPDLIIMDLELTVEHGWEILKLLKETPATQAIPVVFFNMSNNGQDSSMLELNYLTKPVESNQLAEILDAQGLVPFVGMEEINKAILVVDDDFDTLQLHSRMVATQLPFYRILQARNGREALQIIQREQPVLVLLDLMMPEMDGISVLEAMRDDERTRNIPVIVLTGQTLTSEDMARLNRGMATVLGKGMFTIQETLDHIMAVISRKRKPGSEAQRVVQKAMAYIHMHFAQPISRSDIASYVGFSERHLTRCFHQEVGITPIAYLNRYRVRQAKIMLDNREKCISEIALDVGFTTSGYFARVFHQEVGVSPRTYLKGNCP